MRSIFAVCAIALVLFPVSAFASCPDIYGPYSCCGTSWYVYSWTLACAGTSGSVSSTTDSCGDNVYAMTGSSATITYTYTIGASDPIINQNNWQASLYVQFSDPTSNANNNINATVSVRHNGQIVSNNTIVSQNGTQGSLDCGPFRAYYYYTAVAGDTITVTVTGSNDGNATI